MNLKSIIEDNNTKASKVFTLSIQALIVLSLISFSVETLPDLPNNLRPWLSAFEIFAVSIFTLEYLLRLWVADKKLRFVFSFYGMIDLLAILPFYLALGIDLRSLRILRLFRLFRLFKLFRYSNAISRLVKALSSIRVELVIFSMACVFIIYFASLGIYYFEHETQPEVFGSIFQSMWWAVATLTTVGYGDVYPVTVGGRVFTTIILFLGLGIIAVPAGLLASALSNVLNKKQDDDKASS